MITEQLRHSLETGEIVTVNLMELAHTLAGTCDYGWTENPTNYVANIMGVKLSDWQTGYLLDSLLNYGFTVPINICWNYYKYPNKFCTGNGNHRFALAFLCGFEEIPVIVSQGSLDFNNSESDEYVTTSTMSELHDCYGPELYRIAMMCRDLALDTAR